MLLFELADRLKMTVAALKRELTAEELAGWVAYARLRPRQGEF
jgi:hypothetical protein